MEHEADGNVDNLNDDVNDHNKTQADARCSLCDSHECGNPDDDLISESILTFYAELQAYPKLLLFVKRLQCCIRKQRVSHKKVHGYLAPEDGIQNVHDAATQTEDPPKHCVDASTQCDTSDLALHLHGEVSASNDLAGAVLPGTEDINPAASSSWTAHRIDVETSSCPSLADQVKQAAECAMQQTSFVYEATSGMYYDYSTGYYYDAERGLYYNGNDGTYYSYDGSTNEFKFHSQAESTYPSSQMFYLTTIQQQAAINIKRLNEEKTAKENKRVKIVDENGEEDKIEDDVDVSLEEGECSDSSASDDSCSDDDITSEKEDMFTEENEVAAAWPPCMRIIVVETALEKLKVGTLFIVTYTGGTLGREGDDHAVLIPDINISKYHAKFSFDESQGTYLVADMGSRNGTYLDGKRLSVAKQESDPQEVSHGCVLKIGCTRLLCHVHSGQETCSACEPGLVQGTKASSASEEKSSPHSKELQRKKELKQLRRKFGLESSVPDVSTVVKPGYEDRAEIRRKTVGSSSEHEKTQMASLDEGIQSENKGYKMLAKMGWSEGQSLGKESQGIAEPVPLSTQQGRSGLGCEAPPPIPEGAAAERKKLVWKKTQQRYQKIEGL